MNTPESRIDILHEKFTSGILGFWIRQYRISYLIVITIVIMGSVAVLGIPKESSPSVKLGIVSITTSYPGTNPVDMDALVTDKLYKAVKDVKGIDKIASNSSLWFSSISLTLKTSADTKEVVNDVRNEVNRVILPADAKTPVVTEVETDTNRAFSIFIYSHDPKASKALLFDRAITLQNAIEKVSWVSKVSLSAGGNGSAIEWWGGNDSAYDVQIIFPEEKLQSFGLTLASIASVITASNRDQPIGNFAIGDKKYDFRIEWKNRESFAFLDLPIPLPKGGSITIGEVATIERKYKNDSINTIIVSENTSSWSMKSPTVSGEKNISNIWFPYVGLTVNKNDSASIFAASDAAKKVVAEYFLKDEFKNFGYTFGIDLADNIRDDYSELLKEAITTLILVFIAMYAFVGFRDSLFATITLPLAFLSTFILLYIWGYTMNFLTNFSLILSFGIAIDTIIVIVQAASAKIRVWYDPKSAIMLALREYAVPIISWVMTTIVVFIPMMFLPGILGKFLAYIPITIFWVLATGLVLAITVNSALYLIFMKRKNTYIDDPHAIEYATDEEKELLLLERIGKEKIDEYKAPLRIRVIHKMTSFYKDILRKFLESTFLRRISIVIPVILLVLSFIFLAPKVGFNLFPGDDNAMTNFTITGPIWQKTEVTKKDLKGLENIFIWYPEIRYTTISVGGNTANISLQLTKKDERKKLGQMDVFALEKVLLPKLQIFEQKWYKVISTVVENGPPGSKAVWLKLIVDNPDKLSTLIQVSKDFETHLKSIEWTKNVSRSSTDTPGQFIFTVKKDLLADLGVSPALIYSQISQTINWVTVGSVENNGEDMNVVLKSSQFWTNIRMEDILSIPITVGQTTYMVSDLVDNKINNATEKISRNDGDIQITVDADLEDGVDSVATQAEFIKFAQVYTFPSGVQYEAGGENQENSELIIAVLSSFFIALIIIFAILTLQFQSFSQPWVILYSVIMALPMVMLWLLLTGNQFSLPFGIGFIAFTGIAVNHGIILIAAINENLKKWVEWITALVEAGSSRLEPMLLTTVTTVLGIFPIALRDKFWSGMGFTIIFGIIAASFLTLFVLKGIYYEMFLIPKSESTFKKIIRKWKLFLSKKRSSK